MTKVSKMETYVDLDDFDFDEHWERFVSSLYGKSFQWWEYKRFFHENVDQDLILSPYRAMKIFMTLGLAKKVRYGNGLCRWQEVYQIES